MIKTLMMPPHTFVPAFTLQEQGMVQDAIRLQQETDEAWFQHHAQQSRGMEAIIAEQERDWCFHLREQHHKAAAYPQEMAVLTARLTERNRVERENVRRIDVPVEAQNVRPISDSRLMRQIKAFQRCAGRHLGKSRVLWAWFPACSRTEPELDDVIWIRYSNGHCERLAIRMNSRVANQDTGTPEQLRGEARAIFERHVQPRLPADQAVRAFKVTWNDAIADRHTALRDHPFTPGVREFYELTTSFRADPRTNRGQWAAAKLCRFSFAQAKTCVQLLGNRLLLLTAGRIFNITWGRFPQDVLLSEQVKSGIQALAWELARRTLNSGAQDQLMALAASKEHTLERFLLAIQLPELMNMPTLLEHVRFLSAKPYRKVREQRPGLKVYLRQLVGHLPGEVVRQLHQNALSVAITLNDSGLTSPDVRADILREYLKFNPQTSQVCNTFDLAWYVKLLGEQRAARHLKVAFGQPRSLDHVAGLARDTQRMLREVQLAFPDWRITPAHHGLHGLHDHLSVVHRQCQTVNLPIPSATDKKLAHLDVTVEHAVLGTLTFERAAYTHDLIQYGQQLHNCVGSYGSLAVGGDVVIVVARTQQGTPHCCLELRGRLVHQYKLNCNASPREQADLDVAAAYLKAARLKIHGGDLQGLNEPMRPGDHEYHSPPEHDLPF